MFNPVRQSDSPDNAGCPRAVVEFHLLGQVPFDACLTLQRRLVYEAGESNDGRIVVLICEHPELITVGRSGSRGHIRLTNEQLARRGLEVRWVSRGGGCILHAPGQLAVYPIAPLERHGWTVGNYMGRLQAGIMATLDELNIGGQGRQGHFGAWGRTGQLVAVGVAIRHGISCHGAFINVNPAMSNFGFIDAPPLAAPPGERTSMSCLLAERRQAVRMTSVRAALVNSLAATFGCERFHLYTGHPLLAQPARTTRESTARAS